MFLPDSPVSVINSAVPRAPQPPARGSSGLGLHFLVWILTGGRHSYIANCQHAGQHGSVRGGTQAKTTAIGGLGWELRITSAKHTERGPSSPTQEIVTLQRS